MCCGAFLIFGFAKTSYIRSSEHLMPSTPLALNLWSHFAPSESELLEQKTNSMLAKMFQWLKAKFGGSKKSKSDFNGDNPFLIL